MANTNKVNPSDNELILLRHIETLTTAIEDALYSLYQNQYMPTHKVDDTANILKSALLKVWEDTDQSAKKSGLKNISCIIHLMGWHILVLI